MWIAKKGVGGGAGALRTPHIEWKLSKADIIRAEKLPVFNEFYNCIILLQYYSTVRFMVYPLYNIINQTNA